MGLACGIGEWDGEGVAYIPPEDYETLKGKRGKRCSCGQLVKPGDLGASFSRFRFPRTDVEVRIYGEDGEIQMADRWLCETCADLFFNLDELGFCPAPDDDMRELVKEYAEFYGS